MSLSVLRSTDAWWLLTGPSTATRIDTGAGTTGELIADRAAVVRAAAGGTTAEVADLELVSPVTAPCRVVAQMTNYVSHVRDSGMNPRTVPLTFFRKTSGSIAGPFDPVRRPAHVGLLDYEVEIGLVIGRPIPVGTRIDATNVTEHVAGLVVTNDVSARDVQLPKTQFYEGKSYPGFTPVGPRLVLLDPDEFLRFNDLRLRLSVNGEPRQDSTVADMIFRPAETLAALARFQRLDPGDLVLTGTPGGTALKAPPKPVEIVGSLLPPEVKWKVFFRRQARNPRYLKPGDVVEASVRTDDGQLDLGTQRTPVEAVARA